jgi:predicted  nucleic acid-binding Zn-ribbon protein
MKAQVSIILKLCVCLISFQLYAQDNNALSASIEQFKIDANEKRQIELKLEALHKNIATFSQQTKNIESLLIQLDNKHDRLNNKITNNTDKMEKEFLTMETDVIQSSINQNRQKLTANSSNDEQAKQVQEQLTIKLKNINQQLTKNRSNIKLLAIEQYENKINKAQKSMTHTCDENMSESQCKEQAKNLLLRELGEQLSGVDLVAFSEVNMFVLSKDSINSQSNAKFDKVVVIEDEMDVVEGITTLKLTIAVEMKRHFLPKDIEQLKIKIDTLLDQYSLYN